MPKYCQHLFFFCFYFSCLYKRKQIFGKWEKDLSLNLKILSLTMKTDKTNFGLFIHRQVCLTAGMIEMIIIFLISDPMSNCSHGVPDQLSSPVLVACQCLGLCEWFFQSTQWCCWPIFSPSVYLLPKVVPCRMAVKRLWILMMWLW